MASFWEPKCMWPSQTVQPCEHDGEIILCGKTSHYIVGGYSYCEGHTKEFVQSNIDYEAARMNATELQDRTEDFLNGEWADEISYNGGGDE